MKTNLLSVFLLAVGILVVGFFLLNFSTESCSNTHISKAGINRPEKAVLFDRNCGTRTDRTIHVSIIPTDEELNDNNTGNVFIASVGTSTVSSGVGGPYVYIGWDGYNKKLFVRYPQGIEVIKKVLKFNDIDISYSLLPDIETVGLSTSEKNQLLDAARSHVVNNSVEGMNFELVFLKRFQNFIVFKVIPFNQGVDEAWLYLEKKDGKWIGISLGTGQIELWEMLPELNPFESRLNQ